MCTRGVCERISHVHSHLIPETNLSLAKCSAPYIRECGTNRRSAGISAAGFDRDPREICQVADVKFD